MKTDWDKSIAQLTKLRDTKAKRIAYLADYRYMKSAQEEITKLNDRIIEINAVIKAKEQQTTFM